MNKHRLSLATAGIAAVAIVAGGWFLGVQPQLAAASTGESQRESIETANTENQKELSRLATQYQNLDSMKSGLAELQASIPSTAQTTSFVREVNSAAVSSGVTITTITIADAQAYQAPEGTGSTVAAGGSAAATSAPSASPSPSATAAPTTPVAPEQHTDASITGANFTVIPVTVAINGEYDKALDFTRSLQSGQRLFLVNTLSATSSDGGEQMWSLGGFVYVLSDAAGKATATPTQG